MVINTIIPYLLMLKRNKISDAEELTRDLMALLASFSGKYYGRRSFVGCLNTRRSGTTER